jgi:hypothetical protein
MMQTQEDKQTLETHETLERLESAVKVAVANLMRFTGFDGFVLDMPAGRDRPPHLVVVGRATEISWLLEQRAARKQTFVS